MTQDFRDDQYSNEQLQLLKYAHLAESTCSPTEALDALHEATSTSGLPLNVMGAIRFPIKSADWSAVQLGKSIFLHKSVPIGWWKEYSVLVSTRFAPILFLARCSLGSFTWVETKRMLQPIGVDRWADELALKYGMRDGFTCPVGGRWAIVFWSGKDISNLLTPTWRILFQTASSFAALRMEQLTEPDVKRIGTRESLSPRELAVLRMISYGQHASEIAKALEIGEETVRSHIKKAQRKLGARNRAQASCEALRQHLHP